MTIAAIALLVAATALLPPTVESAAGCPTFSDISTQSSYYCDAKCVQRSPDGRDLAFDLKFGLKHYKETAGVCVAALQDGVINGTGGMVYFSIHINESNLEGSSQNGSLAQSWATFTFKIGTGGTPKKVPWKPRVILESSSKRELVLKWTLPEGSPPAASFNISYQVLEHKGCSISESEPVMNKTTDTHFTIRELDIFSRYKVCVSAMNEDQGPQACDSYDTQNVDAQDIQLRIAERNQTTVVVQWENSMAPADCPTTYLVELFPGSNQTQETTKRNRITFDNLTPDTQYMIQLSIINGNEGSSKSWNFTTLPDESQMKAIEPRLTLESLGKDYLNVSWTLPPESAPAKQFIVVFEKIPENKTQENFVTEREARTPHSTLTIRRLDSNSQYRVCVIAVYEIGYSQWACDNYATLSETAPSKLIVNLESRGHNYLELSWTLPRESLPADHFSVSYQLCQHNDCQNPEYATTTSSNFTVKGLGIYSKYKICVTPINEEASGPQACHFYHTSVFDEIILIIVCSAFGLLIIIIIALSCVIGRKCTKPKKKEQAVGFTKGQDGNDSYAYAFREGDDGQECNAGTTNAEQCVSKAPRVVQEQIYANINVSKVAQKHAYPNVNGNNVVQEQIYANTNVSMVAQTHTYPNVNGNDVVQEQIYANTNVSKEAKKPAYPSVNGSNVVQEQIYANKNVSKVAQKHAYPKVTGSNVGQGHVYANINISKVAQKHAYPNTNGSNVAQENIYANVNSVAQENIYANVNFVGQEQVYANVNVHKVAQEHVCSNVGPKEPPVQSQANVPPGGMIAQLRALLHAKAYEQFQ